MWQWLQDQSYQAGSGSAGWKKVVGEKGELSLMADNADVKLFAGGSWSYGSACGSRSRGASVYRWAAYTMLAGRFLSRAVHK